ncbi:MAG: hypothetical protein OXN94_17160 [Chloroflexota bacterium]|nr:hypothetical protein [Chloroflexota bacterium]
MNEMIANTEGILLYQLRDAYFSGNQFALLHSFYGLARTYWANGLAEAAAENLAFILLQDDLPPNLQEAAEALLADIESRICPRIILDARTFAAAMDLQGMVEYLIEDNIN